MQNRVSEESSAVLVGVGAAIAVVVLLVLQSAASVPFSLRTETTTSTTDLMTTVTATPITSTVTGNPLTRTSTLNLTVTSVVTVAPPNYALLNSSVSNGLEVSALIGPVHVATGQSIAITIWVSNTLSRVVTVNATGIINPIVGPA